MISIEQMSFVLKALPDPAFILSRSGKYVALFGGCDTRYYHDGSALVGSFISDLIKPDKANWFLEKIALALSSRRLVVEEYELSNKDVLGLPDVGPQEPIWFEGRVQALDFLVDQEEVVLWVASNISERHTLELKLRELVDTDQLTGLFNRRRLERDLAQHYQSYARYSLPTSILIFDLDNLKTINDTLGHHAGDAIIQDLANICRTTLRKTDTACRFGGDEFVLVLPNTEAEQALMFAQRLHQIFGQQLKAPAGVVSVTVSIGVAAFTPADTSYEDTLKRADRALYQAKETGKNQVVCAEKNLHSLRN